MAAKSNHVTLNALTPGRPVRSFETPGERSGKTARPHDKEALKKQRTEEDAKAINDLQDAALCRRNPLRCSSILQGMDCSGKDGVVRARLQSLAGRSAFRG